MSAVLPGFPKRLLPLARCTYDGGELSLGRDYVGDSELIVRGRVTCARCARQYAITDGVLVLLDHANLDAASAKEQSKRDSDGSTHESLDHPAARDGNEMDMQPVLREVCAGNIRTILEVGCGEGRYTLELARCADILALDFSIELLGKLRERLPVGTHNVGLVLADATNVNVAPGAFDVVLSTLTSNLPTAQHRHKLYDLARSALIPTGRFVFSSHFQGIRQWLAGEPKSGNYKQGGIYRYNFGLRESAAEARRYFHRVRVRPTQIFLPLSRTLRLPVVAISRLTEHVPGLNMFGSLLLGVAERPRN